MIFGLYGYVGTRIKPSGSLKKAMAWELSQEIEEYCENAGVPSPGVFAAKVMAGEDPRLGSVARIYELCEKAHGEERSFSRLESAEIMSLVLGDERYKKPLVTLQESIQACKQLMEFLYAKKKSIEVQGHLTATVAVSEPLSAEEIDLLNEKFLTDF